MCERREFNVNETETFQDEGEIEEESRAGREEGNLSGRVPEEWGQRDPFHMSD